MRRSWARRCCSTRFKRRKSEVTREFGWSRSEVHICSGIFFGKNSETRFWARAESASTLSRHTSCGYGAQRAAPLHVHLGDDYAEGYKRSNSGSPCNRTKSGSFRAQLASLNPASQALAMVSSASGFFFRKQYVHAAL